MSWAGFCVKSSSLVLPSTWPVRANVEQSSRNQPPSQSHTPSSVLHTLCELQSPGQVASVGASDGLSTLDSEAWVGANVGIEVGSGVAVVGTFVGEKLGASVGVAVGERDDSRKILVSSDSDEDSTSKSIVTCSTTDNGVSVGDTVGCAVGSIEGRTVGTTLGSNVGSTDGRSVVNSKASAGPTSTTR